MRTPLTQRRVLLGLVFTMVVGGAAFAANVIPVARHSDAPREAPPAQTGPEQSRVHEIDQQLQSLRAQFKSQADPLQAQLKALREKLDADLKPLQDERRDLAQRSETPEMRALDDDETAQLAALADREKADVEKVHQDYSAQRTALKASFDQKRKDLRAHH